MFQGLITDKPSSETWEYRNCYNNSSVQTMQCCLTSKNYKTYMYLSTDPCSLASMSYQLFLKQLIWIGTISYVYFICFQTGNFFLQSQNSTSAIYVTELEKFKYYWITRKRSVYVTELEKFEIIGLLKDRVLHCSAKIMQNRSTKCIVCDSRTFMQFLWNC